LIQRCERHFNSTKVTNFIYVLVASGSMNWGLESHFVTNFFILLHQSAVSTFGLVINLCGFAILSIWIMDGKDYVFPPKHRKGSEGQE